MQGSHIAIAVAAATSFSVAHAALPSFSSISTDLGVDPVGKIVGGIGSNVTIGLIPEGISRTFTFNLTTLSNLRGSLLALDTPLTISAITLAGGTLISPSSILGPSANTGSFSFSNLGIGSYSLTFSANTSLATASYIGTVSVTPVPEAQTYALALAGLGVVGLMAARRKKA